MIPSGTWARQIAGDWNGCDGQLHCYGFTVRGGLAGECEVGHRLCNPVPVLRDNLEVTDDGERCPRCVEAVRRAAEAVGCQALWPGCHCEPDCAVLAREVQMKGGAE